jgi:hypothetical protein
VNVAEPLFGIPPSLVVRHPGIDVFLCSHLEMKQKLILDASLRCRA